MARLIVPQLCIPPHVEETRRPGENRSQLDKSPVYNSTPNNQFGSEGAVTSDNFFCKVHKEFIQTAEQHLLSLRNEIVNNDKTTTHPERQLSGVNDTHNLAQLLALLVSGSREESQLSQSGTSSVLRTESCRLSTLSSDRRKLRYSQLQSASPVCVEGNDDFKYVNQDILSYKGNLSTDNWVECLKLSISACISYSFLHTVLQLIHTDTLHPLVLHILSLPSTRNRLNRFGDSNYCNKVFLNSLGSESSATHPPNFEAFSSCLQPYQLDALSLLGLSATSSVLYFCTCQCSQTLGIDVGSALDCLLALLLRRRLSNVLTISIPVEQQSKKKSDNLFNNINNHTIETDIQQSLNLVFSDVDLELLDWSQYSLRKELISVFLQEFKSHCDCLSLLSALDIYPLLKITSDIITPQTTVATGSGTARTTSRTQKYYLASANKMKQENELIGSVSYAGRLFSFSLIVLKGSLNFSNIYKNLWARYYTMSHIDTVKIENSLENQRELFLSTDKQSVFDRKDVNKNESNISEIGHCNRDNSDELIIMKLRAAALFQTYALGCCISFIRYAPSEIHLDFLEAQHMCEFICERQYLGIIGHAIILKESTTIDLILDNSPTLLSVTQDLALVNALFVVSLHELYKVDIKSMWLFQHMAHTGFHTFHSLFHNGATAVSSAPTGSTNIWSIAEAATDITVLAYAIFCSRISTESAHPIDQSLHTPMQHSERIEVTTTEDFANAVLPNQCGRASIALSLFKISPNPTVPLFETNTMNDMPTSLDLLSSSSSTLLWNEQTSVLSTVETLNIGQYSFEYHTSGLPPVSETPLSLASVLRSIVFDLIEATILSINLHTLPGLHLLLDFSADLFAADHYIAARSIQLESEAFQLSHLEHQELIKHSYELSNKTFWSVVIETFLIKLVPYSMSLLLKLLTALLPHPLYFKQMDIQNSGYSSRKQRFILIMKLLCHSCTHICVPPIFSGIVPVNSFQVPERSPFRHKQNEIASNIQSPQQPLRDHLTHELYEHQGDQELLLDKNQYNNDDYSNHSNDEESELNDSPQWDNDVYTIQDTIHLNNAIASLFSLTQNDLSNTNSCYLHPGLIGRVIPMPLESINWSASRLSPVPLSSPETPILSSFNNLLMSPRLRRRYHGPVWAVGTLSSIRDIAQSWERPIDLHELQGFYSRLEQLAIEHETDMYQSIKKENHTEYTSIVPNPFSRTIEDTNEDYQRWIRYQLLCLSPGTTSPFTIEWDLSQCHYKPPNLLNMFWMIWKGLLDQLVRELQYLKTEHPQCFQTIHMTYKINMIHQIVTLFSALLSIAPSCRPGLNRLLCYSSGLQQDVEDADNISPTAIFLQLIETASLVSHLSQISTSPSASLRLLFVACLQGLDTYLRPVSLNDIRVAVIATTEIDLIQSIWDNGIAHSKQDVNVPIDALGPSQNSIHLHWLFKIVTSPISSPPVLNGKRLPHLPIETIFQSIQLLCQSTNERRLSLLLELSVIQLIHTLLTISPLPMWTRSPFDEALLEAQLTRETLVTLIRSQVGMSGDWNLVNRYVSDVEDELWQMISSILPPALTMEKQILGEEQNNHSIVYQSDIIRDVCNRPDLSLLQGILKIIFEIGWEQATSSLYLWDINERSLLLMTVLPLLNEITHSFSVLNTQLLDVQSRKTVEDDSDAIDRQRLRKDYSDMVINLRALQNLVLNTIAEHNVLASAMNLIACDGHLFVVGLPTQNPSQKTSPSMVIQHFQNKYMTQAYLFDLLCIQSSHHVMIPSLTLISSMLQYKPIMRDIASGIVGQSKDVINGCIRIMNNLFLSISHIGDISNQRHSMLQSIELWGDQELKGSLLFSKLFILLSDTQSSIFQRLSCCPWGGELNVSLSSLDLFETLDQKFMLDMSYERTKEGWEFPVNMFMTLIAYMGGWGRDLFMNCLMCMRLSLKTHLHSEKAFQIDYCPNQSMVSSTDDHHSKSSSFLSQFLIQLPSEFLYYISQQHHTPPHSSELHHIVKNDNDSNTSTVWVLSSQLEASLFSKAIDSIFIHPGHLNLLFSALINQSNASLERCHVSLSVSCFQTETFFVWLNKAVLNFASLHLHCATHDCYLANRLFSMCLFWLQHFLVRTNSHILSDEYHLNTVDGCELTVDDIKMLLLSLKLLRILLNGQFKSQYIPYMNQSCHQFIDTIVPKNNVSPAVSTTDQLKKDFNSISGWLLLEHVSKKIVQIWDKLETQRYETFPNKLPSTDMMISEIQLGYLGIPGAWDSELNQSIISGSTRILPVVFHKSKDTHQDSIPFTSSPIKPEYKSSTLPEISFVCLPSIIESYGIIVEMITESVMAYKDTLQNKHSSPSTTTQSANYTHSVLQPSLSKFPFLSLSNTSSQTTIDSSIPKEIPTDESIILSTPFDSKDFVFLYKSIVMTVETPSLLLGMSPVSTQSSSIHYIRSMSTKNHSIHAFPRLLPSTLTACLFPLWFQLLDQRGMFDYIVSPSCPSCYEELRHTFHTDTTLSATEWRTSWKPPFDCGFINECPSDKTSRQYLSNLFDLLFGTCCQGCESSVITDITPSTQRCSTHSTESQLSQTTFHQPEGQNIIGDRTTLFTLSMIFFSQLLWNRIIYSNHDIHIQALSDSIQQCMNSTVAMIELSSVISIEMSINRCKHTVLMNLSHLLQESRTARLFPMIFKPFQVTHPIGYTQSTFKDSPSIGNKPFEWFIVPATQMLSHMMTDRLDLFGKSRDILCCSHVQSYSYHTISFGALFIDFVIQLLTANWESDTRGIVGGVSSILSQRLGQQQTSSENYTATSQQDLSAHIPSIRIDSTHTESFEISRHQDIQFFTQEFLPRISLYASKHHDFIGTSVCASSLWQPHMLQRPPIHHPDSVWLLYPFCLLVPCIPSIDILETLQQNTYDQNMNGYDYQGNNENILHKLKENNLMLEHSTNTFDGSKKNVQQTQQMICISTLLQHLIMSVWERCCLTIDNCTQELSSNGYGFETLSDVCRGFLLLQILLRTWISLVISVNIQSEKYCGYPFSVMAPVSTIAQLIIAKLSEILLATSAGEYPYSGYDCNVLARILFNKCRQDRQLKNEYALSTESPISERMLQTKGLFFISLPILLTGIICTILESVQSALMTVQSFSKDNDQHTVNSVVLNDPQRCIKTTELKENIEFARSSDNPSSLIKHDYFDLFMLSVFDNKEVESSSSNSDCLKRLITGIRLLSPPQNFSDHKESLQIKKRDHISCDTPHPLTYSRIGDSGNQTSPFLLSRSLWIASIDFSSSISLHMSLITLSLLNYLIKSPTISYRLSSMNPVSFLCVLPGSRLFSKPLTLMSDGHNLKLLKELTKQDHHTLSCLQNKKNYSDYWRPPYERYLPSPTSNLGIKVVQNLESFVNFMFPEHLIGTSEPIRSKNHLAWCRILITLCANAETEQIERQNKLKKTSSIGNQDINQEQWTLCIGKSMIDVMIRFRIRFHYVFTTVKQSGQLALLEEMFIILRLMGQLPSLESMDSKTDMCIIVELLLTAFKSVRKFAQLSLGRGQIEMAEIFKPVSLKELYAGDLIEHSQLGGGYSQQSCSIPSGQSATVPSLFHQRVIILIFKMLQQMMRALRQLQLHSLPLTDLAIIAETILSTPSQETQHHETLLHSSVKSTIGGTSPLIMAGDLLEVFFHELVDTGRLVLQLLEDLPKLQRQVFIGVCTHPNHLLLPLSLSLRCEGPVQCDIHHLSALGSLGQSETDGTIGGVSNNHTISGLHSHRSVSPKGLIRVTHSPTCLPHYSPGGYILDTPPPTPKLTAVNRSGTTWDSSTVVSRRSSPLIQRYASGTSMKGINSQKNGIPIMFYSRVGRTDSDVFSCDPNAEGFLPEFVTFSSILKVLHSTVEASLLMSFFIFDRLALESNGTVNIGSTQPSSVFSRPSVLRRLSEFLTALQSTVIDQLRNRSRLIEKMMTIISVRLGDDPKTIQTFP